MTDADPPEQREPSEALFKSPTEDIPGLESFADETETAPRPSPVPTPWSRPDPAPRPQPVTPRVTDQRGSKHRSFSVFMPFLLICVGVVILLSNLGYLPNISWSVLWRLWPLVLIGMGIDALIGRRSKLGSVIGTLLILALLAGGATLFFVLYGSQIPLWVQSVQSTGWRIEQVEQPLSGVHEADISIDWGSAPGRLRALEDSPNLIEGDLAVRGRLIFDIEEHNSAVSVRLAQDSSGSWLRPISVDAADKRWDVRLSPRVPIELSLDAGSGSGDYDLTGLQISDLYLDVGSGSVDLELGATDSYEARIEGGSGSLRITLPPNVGARVELESGSGSFQPDDRFRLVQGERDDDSVWQTDNYGQAEHAVRLKIDQKSGTIRIR